jgi:type VI secretion system secreted protein Hcp
MHSYLRIDGVAGSSTESGYEGWIECDSVSWSLRSAGVASGRSEIRFVKPGDVASPVLAQWCIDGRQLAGARFDFLRVAPDGGRTKCYQIDLEQVIVANVAGGPRRAEAMMESVVLTFAHARLTSSVPDEAER